MIDFTVKYFGTLARPLDGEPDVWEAIPNETPEGAIEFCNADCGTVAGEEAIEMFDAEVYEVTGGGHSFRIYVDEDGKMERQ